MVYLNCVVKYKYIIFTGVITGMGDSPKQVRKEARDVMRGRYDEVGHICRALHRKGEKTCKMPGCKSETQMVCVKCDLNLCCAPNRNCFENFHIKP